jgi:hypothetical protein
LCCLSFFDLPNLQSLLTEKAVNKENVLTSEFNPSANKIDVGDVDFNDNVVKKRVLTNEVNILENDVNGNT